MGMLRILDKRTSRDGATKYLFGLEDGTRIEPVFLEMNRDNKDSVCISSQAGFASKCTFCSTGTLGLSRNLSTTEIAAEVHTVFSDLDFRPTRCFDLSYMEMSESLLNLKRVIESKELVDAAGWKINYCLSTDGIPSKIRELSANSPDFSLQISLHAPNDELRSSIIPINREHPIEAVLTAAEEYASASGRLVILNYCLIEGVNDKLTYASDLARLIEHRPFRVQVVRLNGHPSIAHYPGAKRERWRSWMPLIEPASVLIMEFNAESTKGPDAGSSMLITKLMSYENRCC
jgi:23S rRNA (adenine2503-C2)-methyltransferase